MPQRKVVEDVDGDFASAVMYTMLSYFGEEVDEKILELYIPYVLTAFDGEEEFGVDPNFMKVEDRNRLVQGATNTSQSDADERYVTAADEAVIYIKVCIARDRAIWGIVRRKYPNVKKYDNNYKMKRELIDEYDETRLITE